MPLADVTTIIGLVISAAISTGISMLASLILKPKPKYPFDATRTPISARGSEIPLILGRRQTTHVFAWVGHRTVRLQLPPGGHGGKGFGSSSTGKVPVYHEKGWHLLCVGPVTKFYAVKVSGKVVWPKRGEHAPVTPATTPSGTHLTCGGQYGTFEIWWGDRNQRVNRQLTSLLPDQPRSGWPNVAYVYWVDCQLGSAPNWPNITYEYEVAIQPGETPLTMSTPMLATGMNPAHALWRLLTAPYPWGVGLPTEALDAAAFETLGQVCETENLGVNVYADQGMLLGDVVGYLMNDVGFMLPQLGRALLPRLARPNMPNPVPFPTLTQDTQVSALPEIEQHHGDWAPDRSVVLFEDAAYNYLSMDVQNDVDVQQRTDFRVQTRKTTLQTVTNRNEAWQIASRIRVLDAINQQAFRVDAARDARLLLPGDCFVYPGVQQLRTGATTISWSTRKVEIQAALDPYSVHPGEYFPADTETDYTGGTGSGTEAKADVIVMPFTVPGYTFNTPYNRLNPDQSFALGVARVRADAQQTGADVYVSADGGANYTNVGRQDVAVAGGYLNAPILASDGAVFDHGAPLIAVGPTFTSAAPVEDMDTMLDLRTDVMTWKNGGQLCLIDKELFYLQAALPINGGFQLLGMIRGQMGTLIRPHQQGAPMTIFQPNAIEPLVSPIITPGARLLVKSDPTTGSDQVDLTTIVPVAMTMGA
jgi:hypothetical protein